MLRGTEDGLIGMEEDFVGNAGLDKEPVEVESAGALLGSPNRTPLQ